MENLPTSIEILFELTTLLAVYIFYVAAQRSRLVLSLLGGWLALQAGVALSGFYVVANTLPPRCVLLFWPPIFLIVGLLLTAKGRGFLDRLDLECLTLLHAIRIPVALLFLWLCFYKMVPELLTFRGRNYDLVVGLTAPFVWYFGLVKKRLGRRVLLAWNLAGFALLVNLVVNAILSGPFRFQLFAFEQPSIAFLYFPFVWMVCCVVPLLFLAHVAAIRRLLVPQARRDARLTPGYVS